MKNKITIIQCAREIAPGGGVSGVAYALEKEYQSTGYLAERFTLSSISLDIRGEKAGSVVRRKLKLLVDVVAFSLWGAFKLYRFCRSRFTVVTICHSDVLFGDIYVNHGLHRSMLMKSKSPYRMVLRNPLHVFLLVREWCRFRFKIHSRIICFSRSDADELEATYPSSRGLVTLIPNGVDIERFRPSETVSLTLRQGLGLKDDDFVLIFVGHEFSRKGLGYAVEALALLPEKVHLLVVGGGAQFGAERYKQRVGELALNERVRFLGTRSDVQDVMNASDAFILPADFEAWPLVGLEAMACGKPVLMTPVGGVPEFLEHGINGLFIKQNDCDIAKKVSMLMGNPEMLACMGVACRKTALQYSWQSIARKYLDLVNDVAADKHRSA